MDWNLEEFERLKPETLARILALQTGQAEATWGLETATKLAKASIEMKLINEAEEAVDVLGRSGRPFSEKQGPDFTKHPHARDGAVTGGALARTPVVGVWRKPR